jgi:hypothetical protein
MKLKDYIEHQYNGNLSAFALTQGVRYDQVRRWLKRNCMVIDGVIYCPISKQIKKGLNDE